MPAGQGKIVDDAVAEAIEAKLDLGQIPPIKARDMGVPTPEPQPQERHGDLSEQPKHPHRQIRRTNADPTKVSGRRAG
jgi:hypothetical protein